MKGRKAKAAGGETGDKSWEEDLDMKPGRRNNAPKIEDAAEERKAGGRVARKSGGIVHHEMGKPMGHAKHIGMVKGEMAKHNGGRKPRMSGGRCADSNPLSSASKGTPPAGHKEQMQS